MIEVADAVLLGRNRTFVDAEIAAAERRLKGGMATPRILIPDNTPLSLLAMAGPKALDWLFAPGAEVWVTDMVRSS